MSDQSHRTGRTLQRDNRRAHKAKWALEYRRIQARITALIEDPKTIPPDVAKLAQAWSTVENTVRDLRMQPRPAPVHVPIPASLQRLLAQQATSTYPNGASPGHLAPQLDATSPAHVFSMPAIVETSATPSPTPERPQPQTQEQEEQQQPKAEGHSPAEGDLETLTQS